MKIFTWTSLIVFFIAGFILLIKYAESDSSKRRAKAIQNNATIVQMAADWNKANNGGEGIVMCEEQYWNPRPTGYKCFIVNDEANEIGLRCSIEYKRCFRSK